jgi:hypothetical protein
MLRFPVLVTTKHSFGSHVWLSMEEDNLHVTEDRIQSLVQGIVGELFVPDNRPRQDQQFGATEACRELDCLRLS